MIVQDDLAIVQDDPMIVQDDMIHCNIALLSTAAFVLCINENCLISVVTAFELSSLLKMPPKMFDNKKRASSSYDNNHFISTEAKEQYAHIFVNKQFIPEQGFLNPGGDEILKTQWHGAHSKKQQPRQHQTPSNPQYYGQQGRARG
ncbi:hypothetical protein IEQ34_013669 [Dendrobium chrysotoxum]|uniref:Uncharacterized protein n=1 Tax=Dendrobium chrysotoxum TaxID=161865 RepID=A0AAV7G980_DENCH|nr:hypothetical protein IEQ34_013669 [Dendrobium chrysotoxum]